MPGLPPLTVVPLFPLILLCPLSRSGFIFFFSFFLIFCFVTVGVYLHELVVAFNFLHGVLFMIAKLPCSSGRQGQAVGSRGTQEAVGESVGSLDGGTFDLCLWHLDD